MNTVDLVVLLVVAVSAILGLLRGFVREVLGLGAWIGAAVAAIWFFPEVQVLARRSIENPDIADPVAFGVTFLAVLIALSLVARALGGMVRRSGLNGIDRTLGLLYGLARGAAFVIAGFISAGLYEPADLWPAKVLEARSLPSIYLGAEWVTQHLPENYRPTLTAPPLAHRERSAELGAGTFDPAGMGLGLIRPVKEGADAARAF